MVDPDRPQVTIRKMRFAYWAPKAPNRHSECVLIISFPQQQWLLEGASILRYICISSLSALFYTTAVHAQSSVH